MEVPKSATIGVRPKRDDEEPLLEATSGRVVELVIPEPEGSPAAAVVEPIQQVPHVEEEVAQPPPPPVNVAVVNVDDLEEETEEEGLAPEGAQRGGGGAGEKAVRGR